jgi:hypothetical protein
MATHADADLILKLYDLRRETVCRKARAWFSQWAPASADEVKAVISGGSREDNAWMRQALSYWEMAFSIANSVEVSTELFAKNSGEGIWFAVKCQALKAKFPDAWPRTMPEAEAFLARSEVAQQKAEMFRQRVATQLG